MAEVLVGTSGWSYRDWVGSLYPPGTPAGRMLALYAERLPTVEAHNTFRRRPRASTIDSWLSEVPPSFRFAPKAHLAITHQRELDGVEGRVEEFFSLLAPLGDRLGPVLFQLPHRQPDLMRLDRLLGALPPARASVFELSPEWNTPDVLGRLDHAGAGLVVVDRDGDEPLLSDVGAVAYVRLRRDRYDEAAVERWARRLGDVAGAGRPVYVYFRHQGDPLEAVRLLDAVRG